MSEAKNREELKKLLGAMQKDEAYQLLATMETLQQFSEIPIHIRVHSPTTPDKWVNIKGRPLKDFEMVEYLRKLGQIRMELITAKNPVDVALTPDELERMHNLFDEYITLSTGLPKEFLTTLGDNRTRYQLFKGIMIASQPSEQDLENIKKFRGDQ
jgi:hypothetical protein